MATRKVKRYNGNTVDGSQVEDESDRGEMTAEQKAYDDEAKGEAILKNMRDTAAAKPAVVTKEQLAKSGYTNLRDYMNAQQGLTRRGGAAPERVTSAAKDVASDIRSQEKANTSIMRQKPSAVTAESYDPDKINFGGTKAEPKKEPPVRKYTQTRGGRLYDDERTMKAAPKSGQGRASQAFAKGGMTASKRADGIAQRGKTRGKMC